MLRGVTGLIVAGIVACGVVSPAARADTDLNGLWRVGVFFTDLSLTFSDVCAVSVAQQGTDLTLSGSCDGAAHPLNLAGAIDPLTGAFSASGSSGGCPTLTVAGVAAADGTRFTGTSYCATAAASGGINANRCGNGLLDGGEICDDGNLIDFDCCNSLCRPGALGALCRDDGNVCTADTCDAGGQCRHTLVAGDCNDGNPCTESDACTASGCVGVPRPEGSPCNDGNTCTSGDSCSSGACTATPITCPSCQACNVTTGCGPALASGCKEASAGSISLRHLNTDSLVWQWQRGAAIQHAEFGAPTLGTNYDLCLYDGAVGATGVAGALVSSRAPAGPNWQATGSGYGYRRGDHRPDGLTRVRLKAGVMKRSRLHVRGRGPDLQLPPLQSITFPLTVQLHARDDEGARCWSMAFDRAEVSGARLFEAKRRAADGADRPNIVVINLDDTRPDGIDRMPSLAQLAADGVSFTNAFVTNPLCAPSRASLLSGLHTPNHGVQALSGVLGGAPQFRARGSDRQTMATWLQAAGYMTGLFGKYINGYAFGSERIQGPGGSIYVPPGWTRWRAMASPEHFGGVRGSPYTVVTEHGERIVYDDRSSDAQYATDLLAGEMREFIADAAAQRRPFLAVWMPYASHVDTPSFTPEPADRHYLFFRDLPPWRPPSFGEADMSDKPRFMQALPTSAQAPASFADMIRRGAYETLLAVDEQLRVLRADLVRLGIERNTVILVTSDNGTSWGEHRLYFQAKECVYEPCLRVPMIVHDPRSGVRGVEYAAPVLNIDIAPTVAELAGVEPLAPTDGVSFAAWIAGSPPPEWRRDFLIEHWRAVRNDTVDYRGQVSDGDQARVIYGDSRHHPRPSTLFEFDAGNGVTAGAVAVPIGATADASFAQLATVVAATVPLTGAVHAPENDRLIIVDDSPAHDGRLLVVERDQAMAFDHPPRSGDWFGVRDVTAGLTYAEHETGEVELYDLTLDPDQLENRAGHPAYAAARQALALRLAELLP